MKCYCDPIKGVFEHTPPDGRCSGAPERKCWCSAELGKPFSDGHVYCEGGHFQERTSKDRSIRLRHRIERRILRATIKDLLKAGYWVSVNDGEEQSDPSDTLMGVMKWAMRTDQDRLFVYENNEMAFAGTWLGWVFFVYGNDGWDVVNDYTTNLEGALKDSLEMAERLAR